MSKVAKFDCTGQTLGVGSYIAFPTQTASTQFTVSFELYVPAATLTALESAFGPGSFGSATFVAFNQASPGEGITSSFLAPGWKFGSLYRTFADITITPDTWMAVSLMEHANSGGSSWDSTSIIDGVTLASGTGGVPGPISPQTLTMTYLGGYGANCASGEIYYVRNVVVKDAANTTVFSDDFSSGGFLAGGWTVTGGASVIDDPTLPPVDPDAGGAGGVRIGVAFNDTTFEASPAWTYITALDDVTAAAYTIDKGKQTEQDQVDATKVVVNVFDKAGVLDPTNSSGPYYGLIAPLLQLQIELWNPVALEWQTRFRGFISDWDYVPYPGSHVDLAGVVRGYTSLEISAIGIMEPLSVIQLQLGAFGDTPPAGTEGNVFFDNATFQDRITQVMGNAGIASFWFVVFTGNVEMAESRYSPSDNVMSVVQDAVDAELPSVANVYEDRLGRLACHGRLAVFDPSGTWTSIAGTDAGRDAVWRYRDWNAGDGTAVTASPTDTAHIRSFAFNNGTGSLINSAYCTPAGIAEADKPGQLFTDATSIAQYGIRSWSKENLYISAGLLTGNTANQETEKYAEFMVTNYKNPLLKYRITDLGFKSIHPDATGAAANWRLLCEVDVGDTINVTMTHSGRAAASPNFSAEPFLVQGIHERVTPLNPDYAMVQITLDVSPVPGDPLTLATAAS